MIRVVFLKCWMTWFFLFQQVWIFLFVMNYIFFEINLKWIDIIWNILVWNGLFLFEMENFSFKWKIPVWSGLFLFEIDIPWFKLMNKSNYLDQSFVQRGWFLLQLENLILYSSQNFICASEIKPIFQTFANPELIVYF